MRRYEAMGRVGLALAAVTTITLFAGTLLAHEGHEHKALGTVAAIDENEIRVETQEGQTIAFVLSSETVFKAGEAPAQRADAKVGSRVVVVYEEEEEEGRKLAKEVLLPAKADGDEEHSH